MTMRNVRKYLTLATLSLVATRSRSLKLYLTYENAECTEYNTIEGTSVYLYDEVEDGASDGFSWPASGACSYLGEEGYWDLNGDWDYWTVGYGYCVTCNDHVGCSVDGTCDTFMNYPPVVTTSGGYQSTGDGQSSTKKKEVSTPPLGMESTVRTIFQSSYEEYEENQLSSTSSTPYYVVGSLIGGLGFVGLVATGEVVRRFRESRNGNNVDTVHESEGSFVQMT